MVSREVTPLSYRPPPKRGASGPTSDTILEEEAEERTIPGEAVPISRGRDRRRRGFTSPESAHRSVDSPGSVTPGFEPMTPGFSAPGTPGFSARGGTSAFSAQRGAPAFSTQGGTPTLSTPGTGTPVISARGTPVFCAPGTPGVARLLQPDVTYRLQPKVVRRRSGASAGLVPSKMAAQPRFIRLSLSRLPEDCQPHHPDDESSGADSPSRRGLPVTAPSSSAAVPSHHMTAVVAVASAVPVPTAGAKEAPCERRISSLSSPIDGGGPPEGCDTGSGTCCMFGHCAALTCCRDKIDEKGLTLAVVAEDPVLLDFDAGGDISPSTICSDDSNLRAPEEVSKPLAPPLELAAWLGCGGDDGCGGGPRRSSAFSGGDTPKVDTGEAKPAAGLAAVATPNRSRQPGRSRSQDEGSASVPASLDPPSLQVNPEETRPC